MLDLLKDMAARQVGKVLASDATLKILSSPQVKNVVVKAINFRAEARDIVEKQVREMATALELVTRDDVAALRRSVRDLEDNVADLQAALDEARARGGAQPASEPAAAKAATKAAATTSEAGDDGARPAGGSRRKSGGGKARGATA